MPINPILTAISWPAQAPAQSAISEKSPGTALSRDTPGRRDNARAAIYPSRNTTAMPQSPINPPPSDADRKPAASTAPQSDDLGPANQVQWFGRPDPGEKPLGLWRLVVITLSGHIGVRPRAKRHEDFRRANGLHVFIAAIVYFVLVIAALIVLTNVVASR